MKQCEKCYRFLSDQEYHCSFCKHRKLKRLNFLGSSLSGEIKIIRNDINVDDRAYNIINLLGKGGFGTVIQVIDPSDGKLYAMKGPLIFDEIFTNKQGNKKEDIERSQKYLEKEIDFFVKYSDDNFLHIYNKGMARAFSKGETESFPVLIMELAQGTIKDIIKHEKEGNKICHDEKNKIIREIVNSIIILHRKNLVHRDLSPDNLFIADRVGISYVLGDLGACKDLYKDYSMGSITRKILHDFDDMALWIVT